jgi:hypothetical protein
MTRENKSYRSYLKEAWPVLQQSPFLYAGVTMLFIGIIAMFNVGGFFLGSFLSTPLMVGFFVTIKKLSQGQDFGFQDVFWPFLRLSRLGKSLWYSIVQSLATFLGFILIIPGIWLVVRWSFASCIFSSLPDSAPPLEALKQSSRLVKGRFLWVSGLLLFLGFLNVLGFLFFMVGAFFTMPLTMLIIHKVVEDLQKGDLTEDKPFLAQDAVIEY